MLTDICTAFGCGRKLSALEKLCGTKCILHQNNILTISMQVDDKINEERKIKQLEKEVKPFIICDGCGKDIRGKPYPAYDENFKLQRGINYCGECYITP